MCRHMAMRAAVQSQVEGRDERRMGVVLLDRPRAESGSLSPVFIKKVLLEHSCALSLMCYDCLRVE